MVSPISAIPESEGGEWAMCGVWWVFSRQSAVPRTYWYALSIKGSLWPNILQISLLAVDSFGGGIIDVPRTSIFIELGLPLLFQPSCWLFKWGCEPYPGNHHKRTLSFLTPSPSSFWCVCCWDKARENSQEPTPHRSGHRCGTYYIGHDLHSLDCLDLANEKWVCGSLRRLVASRRFHFSLGVVLCYVVVANVI